VGIRFAWQNARKSRSGSAKRRRRSRRRSASTAAVVTSSTLQARAWRPDPEAERVASLAEERLRRLRPDEMEQYDRLREHGVEPVQVSDAPGRPVLRPAPARPGEAGPDRATLTEADTARRAATAETGRYRQQTAVLDDPGTSGFAACPAAE